jgi:hypothetical protein
VNIKVRVSIEKGPGEYHGALVTFQPGVTTLAEFSRMAIMLIKHLDRVDMLTLKIEKADKNHA